MLELAWSGVRHNSGRYIATLVAIMTGVAFFVSTGFVSDRVISALEGDVDRQYSEVDAVIIVDTSADSASNFGDALRIGGDIVDDIAALPEVEATGGDLSGSVAFKATDGGTFADDATGRLWIEDEPLNPIDVAEGAAPSAAGEIAVDRGLADDEDLQIGEQVTILTLAGEFDATIVGVTSFGDSDAHDSSGTVSISSADAFDWLNSGQVEYEDLYLRGTVDQAQLEAAVEPLVPAGFQIQTGDDFRQDKRDEIGAIGRILKTTLQAFAILALFVGGFVIYNTFSVIVAQRVRELAVLAAVGATPKQLKRSLRYEGLVVGIIGSVLGVLAGLALAFLLMFGLDLFGVSLPGSGVKVAPRTVIGGIVAGTVITLASVMIPARRASRTEPIEALRQAAVEGGTLTSNRIAAASALTGLGAAAMLFGSAPLIGLGALMLFVGVIVAGPIIAVGGSRLTAPLFSRMGLEGRLATDNIARNPKRTASTSNALLIGVFLVTLVTVAGTSAKDFTVDKINELSSADYVIESDGGTVDDQLVADLEAIDGVKIVTPFRRESVTIDGNPGSLSTGDIDAIVTAANIQLTAGSIDDLGPGRIVAFDLLGSTIEMGSTVSVIDSFGDTVELEVVGLIKSSIDTIQTGSFVDPETFDGFVGDTAPTLGFIDVETGAQTDTEDAIEDLTNLRPDITLTAGNELGQMIGSIFDFVITAVNGLLLMSVAVALIGIVNTLSLSILERRRELGLLRVVGMVDKRVQRMVRLESVLISALGTVTGIALGMFTGWALIFAIDRKSEAGIPFSFPVLQILVVIVLGIGLGFLASLIPARRSTRLEVLDAIGAT
jgi:putative ABC transport system permease protein